MVSGNISESPEHKIKLEYEHEGALLTVLWEPKSGAYLLQTSFDENAVILDQKLINLNNHGQKEVVEAYMDANGIEPKESVYEDVKFRGNCPNCGKPDLVRYASVEHNASKIPIMPIYTCSGCGSKAYNLADAYLKKLVMSDKSLFENIDLEDMARDEQKFINELKAYIVRVFASKHILNAK